MSYKAGGTVHSLKGESWYDKMQNGLNLSWNVWTNRLTEMNYWLTHTQYSQPVVSWDHVSAGYILTVLCYSDWLVS